MHHIHFRGCDFEPRGPCSSLSLPMASGPDRGHLIADCVVKGNGAGNIGWGEGSWSTRLRARRARHRVWAGQTGSYHARRQLAPSAAVQRVQRPHLLQELDLTTTTRYTPGSTSSALFTATTSTGSSSTAATSTWVTRAPCVAPSRRLGHLSTGTCRPRTCTASPTRETSEGASTTTGIRGRCPNRLLPCRRQPQVAHWGTSHEERKATAVPTNQSEAEQRGRQCGQRRYRLLVGDGRVDATRTRTWPSPASPVTDIVLDGSRQSAQPS